MTHSSNTTQEQTILLPCPWCGCEVEDRPDLYPRKTFHGAIVCKKHGMFEMTPEEWNDRK